MPYSARSNRVGSTTGKDPVAGLSPGSVGATVRSRGHGPCEASWAGPIGRGVVFKRRKLQVQILCPVREDCGGRQAAFAAHVQRVTVESGVRSAQTSTAAAAHWHHRGMHMPDLAQDFGESAVAFPLALLRGQQAGDVGAAEQTAEETRGENFALIAQGVRAALQAAIPLRGGRSRRREDDSAGWSQVQILLRARGAAVPFDSGCDVNG